MRYDKLAVDFGVWGTVRKVAVTLVIAGILVGLGLCYIPILKQTASLQKENEIKREALRKQQALHQRYSEEIVALRTDPEAVERAIRERLHLVKPDEVIFHFESPQPEK